MKFRSFTFLLPLSALLGSIVLLIATTGWSLFALKRAAHGSDTVVIGSDLVLQSNNFLPLSFFAASLVLTKPIAILHAPAHFVEVVIAYLVARKPFWWPAFIGPAEWQCLTYPFFALPAWAYVGFGLDALLQRKTVRTSNMVTSVILALIFGILAAGLYIGLRDDPGLLPGKVAGLAFWTFLFSIPFLAWLRQKLRARSARN